MNAKSGRAAESNLALRIYLARCPSQCNTNEERVSRPDTPCSVTTKGWPCFVVFVVSQVPCSADAESCKESHGILCASPNPMLPCTQSRTAPKNKAMLGAVLASQTHLSNAITSASGTGYDSLLSLHVVLCPCDAMTGDAMHSSSSCHSTNFANQRRAFKIVRGDVRCSARSCTADRWHDSM